MHDDKYLKEFNKAGKNKADFSLSNSVVVGVSTGNDYTCAVNSEG